jgi:glycosyltransferase involved in cell wall biosynthesis
MHQNILCANRVLCNSEFSRDRIAKAYPGVDPLVSSIGVTTDDFHPPSTLPEPGRLITVGALDPSKNHDFALEVASQKPGGLDWEVQLVTDRRYGDTAQFLEKKAERLGVKLSFNERVSRERLVELYGESYACVYFPIEEPFGIVSVEAQSCGTPVLGVDEGGIRETLETGVGGSRLPRDVNRATEVLEGWVQDRSHYESLRKGARDHVLQNWKVEDRIEQTRKLIEECFSGPSNC